MTRQRLLVVAIPAAVILLAILVHGVAGHPHNGGDLGFRHHLHSLPAEAVPRLVGQEALGAVQEVVGLLMADPETDWTEISIARLRRHLIDLDDLMLHADVAERPSAGGLAAVVRGRDRTLAAVRRLVPAHAEKMTGFRDWKVSARDDGESIQVKLTSDDPAEVEVVRALGFFGFMASGVHHPHQLMAVARGRGMHWPEPVGD